MWHADPGPLAAWRQAVIDDPERVHAAIDDPAFVTQFGTVNGERLKRMPAGLPADHPDAELLTLKDITFGRRLADSEAFSPNLPNVLADDLAAAAPLLRLLDSLS
jgi:uncharacterized protein (DUF2461 family)